MVKKKGLPEGAFSNIMNENVRLKIGVWLGEKGGEEEERMNESRFVVI